MKYFHLLIAVVSSVAGLPAAVHDGERISAPFYPLPLAKSGDFPYVVSITENDRHFCGGFIYNERWIITSASCVEGKTITKLKVIVGQVNAITPDPNEQTFIIYSITPMPLYDSSTKVNDIALLQLSTEITFDYVNVDFAAYNEVNYALSPVIMGWGATFSGTLESANLHYGDIGIVNTFKWSSCDLPLFDFATMMCASSDTYLSAESNDFITPPGPQPVYPCQYDEGSPMVQINADSGVHTVVGILSHTSGFCYSNSYSVYTRVSVYFSWLINTAGQQPIRPTTTPVITTTTTPTTTTYTTTATPTTTSTTTPTTTTTATPTTTSTTTPTTTTTTATPTTTSTTTPTTTTTTATLLLLPLLQ